MWSNWIGRISGGGSVALGFAALYFDRVAKNPKPALWILAGVCFVFASFSVWYKDRPQLYIDIERSFLDTGIASGEEKGIYLTLMLRLRNTRPETNCILEYAFEIKTTVRRYIGRAVSAQNIALRKRDGLILSLTLKNLSISP